MRKMWKKSFILLIVLGLALGGLVGCGTSGGDSGSQDPNGDNGEEVVEITLTSWRTEEIAAFEKLNAEFNKEFPNIRVKYEPIQNTEYDSVLSMSLNTNTAADLMYVRPFDRGVSLYESGYLLEITEENTPNLANISQAQRDVYMTDDGELSSLPYIYVSYGFIYNKAIFDKYGLEEPKTWDEFFNVLDVLKENGETPLALGTRDGWVVTEIVSFPNYANFVDGENWRQDLLAGNASLDDPGFMQFMESLERWKDYMPRSYQGIGYVEAQQLFLSEQAAIFPAGSWEIGNFASQNPDLEMGIFTSLVVEEGNQEWLGFNGGAGIGINKNSPHVEEALIYLNWLASEEAQIMTGNLMAGLYPSASVPVEEIEDPLARKWIEAAGPNGENFAVGWGWEKLNRSEPTAYELAMDNTSRLLNGEITAREAVENIKNGIDRWYIPGN